MICDTAAKQLPLLLYGELTFDEEEAVQQHLESCGVLSFRTDHDSNTPTWLDDAEVEVDPALLADCRRNLRIATSASPRRWPRRVSGRI